LNKIEALIEKHCPNGVATQPVGNLCEIRTGKKDVNQGNPKGEFPFFTCSRNHTYSDTYSFDGEALLIAGNGVVGLVQHFKGKFEAYQRTYVLMDFKGVELHFLRHYLRAFLVQHLSKLQQDGTIPYIKLGMLKDFQIPIPPIEVQREIVEILDNFIKLEAELETELEAELEARKSQYSYYRESLFDEDVSASSPLDSVASIWRGRRFVKDDIQLNGVPAIHYGEIYTKFGLAATEAYSYLDPALAAKLRFASPGDVILVSAGETIEDIGKSFTWLGTQDVVIHDACYGIRSETVDPRYMVHFFNTHNFRSQLRKYISSSKISAVSTDKLGKVFIPVPSLEKQRRVADVLDVFDKLISDISIGLPEEIKARRQQYDHYRNKLLLFSEQVVT
jgi:type I restriction enzyme S subunit